MKKSLYEEKPELAKEWHPTKNGKLTSHDVSVDSERIVWWFLPYHDPETGEYYEYEWKATVKSRAQGCGCPYLATKGVIQGYNDLATIAPELVKEWHSTRNGELSPSNISAKSNKLVWWIKSFDDAKIGKQFDYEWQDTVANRVIGSGCPYVTDEMI